MSEVSRQLDVRTKLLLVILGNILVLLGMREPNLLLKESLFIGLFISLLVIRKRYRSAVIYSSLFAVLVLLTFLGKEEDFGGFFLPRIGAFCWGAVKFYPGAMAGAYLIHSSSASMLFQGFDQLHLPRQMSIPFVVMLRFIPHFAEEFKTVVKMLRLRRSTLSFGRRFRPDFYLLPLLNTAIKSAEDLSKAANARGLTITGKRTYYQKNHPTYRDALVLMIAIGIILL